MLWLTSFLSAISAFCAAILVTIAIEKKGGRLGGVISSSPTTVIPFSIAIAYTVADNAAVHRALFTTPIGMFLNSFFLLYWREMPHLEFFIHKFHSKKQQLGFLVPSSLFLWLSIATGVNFLLTELLSKGVPIQAMGGFSAALALSLGLFALFYRFVPTPAGKNKVSIPVYLCRGLLAGTAVGVGISISSASSTAAGLVSAFPSIFLTSMVSLWISQSSSVPVGAAGPMMLSSLSVSSYSMLFAVLLSHFTESYSSDFSFLECVVLSVFIAYLISIFLVCIPIFFLLTWAKERAEKRIEREKQGKIQGGKGGNSHEETIEIPTEGEKNSSKEIMGNQEKENFLTPEEVEENQILQVLPKESENGPNQPATLFNEKSPA